MQFLRIFMLVPVLYGGFAWAQARPGIENSAGRTEIYGGPVFAGSNPSGAIFGAGGGVGYDLSRNWGMVGEFTMIQTTSAVVNTVRLSDYMVGPRYWFGRSLRMRPFVDGQFGGQYLTNSSNHHTWYYSTGGGPAVAANAGIEVGLTRHLAVRGQIGYVFSRFTVGSSDSTNNRFSAAPYLVYRF